METETYSYPSPPGNTNNLWITVNGDPGDSGEDADCSGFDFDKPGSAGNGGDAPNLSFSVSGANTSSYVGGLSAGGKGGNGGDGGDCYDGRGGGTGGNAGTVVINLSGNAQILNSLNAILDTEGNPYIFGLIGSALAGNGGNGGSSGLDPGNGGKGGMTESSADTGYGAGTVAVVIDRGSSITTSSDLFSVGVIGQSAGGKGGDAGDGTSWWSGGSDGGNGGYSGPVSIVNDGNIELTLTGGSAAQGAALLAQSVGGQGGNASDSGFTFVTYGNTGGTGGMSDVVSIIHRGVITTTGTNAIGINAQSVGGGGGSVPGSTSIQNVGDSEGGAGGDASNSSVDVDGGRIHTYGDYGIGVLTQSIGGGGGSVGGQTSLETVGSIGGGGGNGQEAKVILQNGAVITTGLPVGSSATPTADQGQFSPAVIVQSIGGGGGNAGTNSGIVAVGSDGGEGGDGGPAVAELGSATILTARLFSPGLLLQSIGGGGGNGGNAQSGSISSDVSVGGAAGGEGGPGGAGGPVQITPLAGLTQISTRGAFSSGLLLQSIGGSGGSGGSATSFSAGVAASAAVAVGGSGGTGGTAGTVTLGVAGAPLTSRVTTEGAFSPGVTLQSIGGGGGTGGDSSAFSAGGTGSVAISVGGSGGTGGDGGAITSFLAGQLQTSGFQSPALSLASIGGGGGSGGSSTSASVAAGVSGSVAVGGSGGDGGSGEAISSSFRGTLLTRGDFSPGLSLQNIGGGGGDGGMSLSLSLGGIGSAAPAVGGSGGGGGGAGASTLMFAGTASTSGLFSPAISARSIGGGGGSGGFALAASGASTASFATAVGGSGGSGGNGGSISATVARGSLLQTTNLQSPGLHLQSIGGGGGNGGGAISGSVAISPFPNLSSAVAVGGSGGNGGDGGAINLVFNGSVSTGKADADSEDITTPFSPGILIQSIGGGGGNGGFSASGGASISRSSSFTGNVAVGGSGGDGGDGGTISLKPVRFSAIRSQGLFSGGLQAQSIGGGGGNGGSSTSLTLTGSATSSWNGSVAVGGNGGDGGNGAAVKLVGEGGVITTARAFSPGTLLQSIGGGGGNGGSATTLLGTGGSNALNAGVAVGGTGGGGGDAGDVTLKLAASVQTNGQHSPGLAAQSVGGGGGQGATSLAAAISGATSGSYNGAASVGGNGSPGGTGGAIKLISSGSAILSAGPFSPTLLAQSIGGGGGNGGNATNLQATFTGSKGYSLGPSIGGQAGSAGDGGAVSIVNQASLRTGNGASPFTAHFSPGILAQSVGGGGGNGGSALSGSLTLNLSSSGANTSTADLGSSVGGNGGGGGDGGAITISNSGEKRTTITGGHFSPGLSGQSIGGGGGSGGSSQSGSLALSGASQISSAVVIGGQGAQGGNGDRVTIRNTQMIRTGETDGSRITGHFSPGLLAQSVGGGGGSGGSSLSSTLSVANLFRPDSGSSSSMALIGSAAVGGSGGSGGDGGAITVVNRSSAVLTRGNFSAGIQAQSIGGGGGSGGNATSTVGAIGSASSTGTVAIGGDGGGGGDGAAVNLRNTASISTGAVLAGRLHGSFSPGLMAQSIGGGGGSGGNATTDQLTLNTSSSGGENSRSFYNVGVSLGGQGGLGGRGGDVTIRTSHPTITTQGPFAAGVLAQSIGGGGGAGGNSTLINRSRSKGSTAISGGLSLGGAGGDGGSAGDVSISLQAESGRGRQRQGKIITAGAYSYGVLAQSIGGGGGAGGSSISTNESTTKSGSPSDINRSGAIRLGGLGGQNWGRGGNGASGGSVAIGGSAKIHTSGVGAMALLAQSIGGGGGAGGDVTSSLTSTAETSSRNQGFVSMALGGEGGAGQSGGSVSWSSNTANGYSLSTAGALAYGALLQSIGGGGGVGGSSTQSAEITAPSTYSFGGFGSSGGFGGAGADGGAIRIGKAHSPLPTRIHTTGSGASGLVAQSLGGGGRGGGGSTTETSSSSSYGASLSFGGAGGDGGRGGALQLKAQVDIRTEGVQASGAVLQSIGGGGGLGGNASSTSDATLPEDSKASTSLNFGSSAGGEGGGGGNGGAIRAHVSGRVLTMRAGADAVLVQSIGGGGGAGGSSTTSTSLEQSSGSGSMPISLGFGGGGGGGGHGGTITLNSSEALLLSTDGDNAAGLTVQSIGGGGGRGGTVSSLGSNSSQTDMILGAAIGIGASGGGGGDGGALLLGRERRPLKLIGLTRGSNASGVMLQSIGGGGGSGSTTSSGATSGSISSSFALGGSGGNGGDADAISMVADLDLVTTGLSSPGAVLQSIGGGGGQGGSVTSEVTADAKDIESNFALGLSAAIGGQGGGGGDAGNVEGQLGGRIQTIADLSTALSLQSIGAGGGDAAEVLASSQAEGSERNASLSFSLGGSGGSGGDGGSVTLRSRSSDGLTVLTEGDSSSGISLQSIGGGGGRASSVQSLGAAAAGEGSLGLSLSIGAEGGDGGDGGAITVGPAGVIATAGTASHALQAQSLGGGGGQATAVQTGLTSGETTINGVIGGKGGNGGEGGAISVANRARLSTGGDNALGLMLQSVGGGGGSSSVSVRNPTAAASLNGQLRIGGVGGDGGSGGLITAINRGWIQTSGQAAHAMLLQSVGGGGGHASIQAGPAATASDLSINLGGTAGRGGDGGSLVVENRGGILTTGEGSQGVMALSIGGGGGSVSSRGAVNAQLGGTGGGGGDGGSIRINNTSTGLIHTSGANAIAIAALSIGGGGGSVASTTGDVTYGSTGGAGGDGGSILIRNRGRIVTQGANAIGVLARSIGGGGGYSTANLSGGDLSLGSSQANRGSAGEVMVINRGSIQAVGDGAKAMLIGSVAGGGGDAGENYGTGQLGMAGGGASGRASQLNNRGDLSTDGNHAPALLHQSIAGGGGTVASLIQGAQLGSRLGSRDQSGADLSTRNRGNLISRQNHSPGMFVQSIGAGGGSVNRVSGDTSLGTANTLRAIDGSAGRIAVNSLGEKIITGGSWSPGIAAQSIGGGGGWVGVLGGDLVLGASHAQGLLSGGEVSIYNRSAIRTQGAGSTGIIGQSIGGGGGFVGASNGTVQLGASSSEGELMGGAVEIIQRSTIHTKGAYAAGVIAQSIGGGGGAVSAASPSPVNSSSLGSNSRQQGSSGNVSITNSVNALISTRGAHAPAVLAQSIGGGGGYSTQKSAFVTMGQENGFGRAGSVVVNNLGTILTQGDHSHGILAQSIGAGGGVAGSAEQAVKLGALNGASGSGNGVLINNKGGLLRTAGRHSIPVVGQSIGAGGGWLSAAQGSVRLGANGGSGDGGTVELNNLKGVISSSGPFSPAFLLQSIGGGGGHLDGATLRGDIAPAEGNSATALLGGGPQGSSGDGGELILRSGNGEINTTGIFSPGVVHQSIGGGGGWIGTISSGDLRLGGRSVDQTNGASLDLTIPMAIRTIGSNSGGVLLQSIGGGGGAAGQVNGTARLGGEADPGTIARGGDLQVIQQQPILTTGADSPALMVQSIGGGGGRVSAVGGGAELGATLNPGVNLSAGMITSSINAGIATSGQRSPGVVLQSIGGGGGYAVSSSSATLGASQASTGARTALTDSGAITLNNNATIRTSGDQSIGVLIQSIAGGGGVAGSSTGFIQQNPTDLNSESGRITINNSGNVFTSGDGAHAVVTQSIAGGGGLVLSSSSPASSSSIGAAPLGRSGSITVNNSGTIQTEGRDAIAVLAQSAINGATIRQSTNRNTQTTATTLSQNENTGADWSIGEVIVSNSGVIRATGTGGIGITKSTNINASNTNLRVINQSGALIQGGPNGAAIQLPTAEQETVMNAGAIIGGPRGQDLAIEGSGGNDQIINNNLIAGNIQISGPDTTILNNLNSRIEADTIQLGPRSELINQGILSPNGPYRIGALNLTAKYAQSASAIYEFDLDLSNNTTDQLIINNPSAIEGSMALIPIKTGLAKPGKFISPDIISAPRLREGDLKFDATNTAIASYQLVPGSDAENSLAVAYQIDYNPSGMNRNSREMGRAFNTIQAAGPNSLQQRLTAAYLYTLANTDDLEQAYEQLSGEQLSAFPQSIIQFRNNLLQANQEAIDSLPTGLQLSCPNSEPSTPQTPCQRWRAWFQSDGFSLNASNQGNSAQSSWSSSAYDLSIGISYPVGEWTTAGFIAQQSQLWTNTWGLRAQGSTELWSGSAFLKQQLGPQTTLSLLMGGGSATNTIHRDVDLPLQTTEQSFNNGSTWQGRLQISHNYELNKHNRASLTPKLSVGLVNYNQPDFHESTESTSSAWQNLRGRFNSKRDPKPSHSLNVEGVNYTSIPIQLQLNYQQDVFLGKIKFTPSVGLGYSFDAGNRTRAVTATFTDEPNAPFTIQGSDAPQSWWDLNAALNVQLSNSLSFFINLEADIAPTIANSYRYGGGFRLRF